ncbi:MAG: hypothetical protein JXA90_04940 [Planctomycetes bacterium]|nr:hypothetical protein [Planctomycetota bacterium]
MKAARRSPALSSAAAVPALGALLLLAGCHLVLDPHVEYLSNEEILGAIADAAGFRLQEDEFRLFHAQILDDFLLLDYRGVAFPGDRATIRRISVKSSEQKPGRLAEIGPLVEILQETREDFRLIDQREEAVEGATLSQVTYTFRAPIRDDAGAAHPGKGIAGTLLRTAEGSSVVYWFNLDNWGDRAEVSRASIEPLLEEMLK